METVSIVSIFCGVKFMKQYLKNFIIYLMVVIFLVTSCPLSVYASEHGGSGGTDHNSSFITDSGTINVKDDGVVMYYIEYIISQIGAIVCDHDITKAMANDQTMKEYISKGKYDANEKTVVFPKETVVYVKQCLDQYAKENEPYDICTSYGLSTFDLSCINNQKNIYDTLKSLIEESQNGFIRVMYEPRTGFLYASIYDDIKDISYVKSSSYNDYCGESFYNSTWKQAVVPVYGLHYSADDAVITSFNNFKSKATVCHNSSSVNYTYMTHFMTTKKNTYVEKAFSYVMPNLLSATPKRFRVFYNFDDFQNYTLGKRKVYYTENYYNYVPADLTTSIDDLQKTVDDMSKVIDQLLDQIGNDTSESEIEELLRQILDELKNNQGGGGGTGGGDVNVDIDLSTTNTLLSKILAKVTQIFDKISETAGSVADTAGAKMQETLDEILAQIKKIKHWTIADTAVGAADAVADWLDFLKDLFSGADDAAEGVVGAISSTMDDAANLMKTKFPFCIPWDVYLIVSFLAEEPQTPVFRLPIKLDRLGIEEYIEVNLEDFEVVSSISRTLLTLMYCYFLLNLTTKIFPIMKEGGD